MINYTGSKTGMGFHTSSEPEIILDEVRAAEVYTGTREGLDQELKTRTRIDWMVARQKGQLVLNIGCNQGILLLHLARRGIKVLAADINLSSIHKATSLIGHEPEKVAKCVRFLHFDVTTGSLPDQFFDTVYLGEIIEQLENPRIIVELAADRLKDCGRLVLTTPHGFLPNEDHIQVIGLSAVIAMLPTSMSVVEIDVIDGYICLIAEKDARFLRPSTEHLIALSERSLVQQQTLLHRHLCIRCNELAKSKAFATDLQQKLRIRKEELDQSKALKLDLESELCIHKEALASVDKELNRILASKAYKIGSALRMVASSPIKHGPKLTYKALRFLADNIKMKLRLSIFPKKQGSSASQNLQKTYYDDFQPLKNKTEAHLPVVAIMDEFTAKCFRYEWNITLLNKKNWRKEIGRIQPLFLFVESAWRGNGGDWSYALTKFVKDPSHPLYALVMYCQSVGVTTVFWGKEDPSNFDTFKEAASIFDVVFTTDEDCIQRYRDICGHNRVYPLPFAAQPILHNPANRNKQTEQQVAFAGGWYNDKHPARQKYLPILLSGADQSGLGLVIFDRFSDLVGSARVKHEFPSRFTKFLKPKLPYQNMLTAYRSFPIFLNVNSVENSSSMFSRRVFELLACGTNVVSSPSVGMKRMLTSLVLVASSAAETKSALNMLHCDPAAARRRAHVGYRVVMLEHTYALRAAEVVNKVAPNLYAKLEEPMVTVIIVTNRTKQLSHAIENYRRQNYSKKELILALNSDCFNRANVESITEDIPDVKIFQIPEAKTLASCLNHVVKYANGKYWAKFDDDDIYGAEYLGDALLPFKYTEAAVVGKTSYFAQIEGDPSLYLRFPEQEHKYVKHVCGGTLVVDRAVTKDIFFDESIEKGSDTRFLKKVSEAGLKIYSADSYNFVQIRHNSPRKHTWNISHSKYLEQARKVSNSWCAEYVLF